VKSQENPEISAQPQPQPQPGTQAATKSFNWGQAQVAGLGAAFQWDK